MSRERKRSRNVIGATFWLFLLLGALWVVAWRQAQGIALERQIREIQGEQALVEAERVELLQRIQALSTRSRITRIARDELGMHLPRDQEIIFLAVPTEAPSGMAVAGGTAP